MKVIENLHYNSDWELPPLPPLPVAKKELMKVPNPSITIVNSINQLRNNIPLSPQDIETIIHGYTRGEIPDYQMSAWLATICVVGISFEETLALTRAYISSGSQLHLPEKLRPFVDKHSTGGIGDKTSLIIAPLVAACGVRICKMTGRGLGITGGTVDKLESIPGIRLDLSSQEIIDLLEKTPLIITGQSDDLTPGDRATYALRDVTGTIDNINLIAASIMSKKIAVNPDSIVLDVKYGTGALMPTEARARELAQILKKIAQAFDIPCNVIISSMSNVLGHSVGNAVEVKEAYAILQGYTHCSDPRYIELCMTMARLLINAAYPHYTQRQCNQRINIAIDSGAAAHAFRRMITAQGGDASVLDDPLWHKPPVKTRFYAPTSGWISRIDALLIGKLCLGLGAGRVHKDDSIRHDVGVVFCANRGEYINKGDVIATIYSTQTLTQDQLKLITQAVEISPQSITLEPLITEII